MSKPIVVGYIDDDGFSYCLKHGNSGMEQIFDNQIMITITEQCSVCGVYINADSSTTK